jgi:SAM-dependent methyltransferase
MDLKFDPVLSDIKSIKTADNSYLVYKYLIPALELAVKENATGKVIDLGCGNKPYLSFFTGKIDSYVGCDFVQNKFNSVNVICDVCEVPFPDAQFDTCFSTQVLEHIKVPEAMILEAFRLLKPGGKLILSAPLYWPEHGEPYDYSRFTRYGLNEMLTKSGFTNIQVSENGGAWATAGQSIAHAFMYSTRQNILFRVLRFAFYRLSFIRISNKLFSYLDRKDYNPVNTMNYVVVAEKSRSL